MTSILLAFGFFFGCATTKSNPDRQVSSYPDELNEAQFEQHLSSLDQQIQSQPENSNLHFQKGALLTKWAQQESPPSKRTALYLEADKVLAKAEALSQTKADIIIKDKIDQLRKVAWSSEHNQGIQLWQNEPGQEEQHQAAIHFENATAIMPDSSTSYLMASRAFYNIDKPQKAIAELEQARANISSPPLSLLELLASLYLETNQPKQAIPVFKEARSVDRLNYNLMHGLANAHMKAGEHSEAVILLRSLTAKKPSNATYRRSLARELYLLAQQKTKAVPKASDDFDSRFSAIDSLLHKANDNYNYLLDKWGKNRDIKAEAAHYYQNAASLYQKLLPHLNKSQKEETSNAIVENLTTAVPLLEELAAESSDKQWWKSLYQAYTFLGMQQKAITAKENL